MDVSEYMPMFLAEGREHLQELNLAVVRIEESPDDRETVDEIFRIAHSLKGMSATMGFVGMAALTHKMEDVFELLKQRSGGLERAVIDVLLECLDALEAAIESIESDGAEALDPQSLITRLESLVRAPGHDDVRPDSGDGDPMTAVTAALADGRSVVHITATLADDVMMASVRALMVLGAAAEHGDVLASVPAESELEGFAAHRVEIWLACEHEADVVSATVGAVPDVAAVGIKDVSAPAPPAELVDELVEASVDEPPVAAAKGNAKHKGAASVRVDAERLDQLMHFMGELVVHRTHAESLAAQADVPGLSQAMADLTRSSQALQAMVMQVRMIPVEAVFLRFPRLVRDLSSRLGKNVDLQLVGQDTELDRTVVDALGDPIVHLVRNSLDHGLEDPQSRAAAGKPETGVLEISARHAGGNVVITVRDDGRGIDPERVAAKALQRGLITQEAAAAIDARGAAELLFAAGFSTADETSDISGRGVGMDAVRTTIRELGGEVFLTSEQGVGTTAQIRLPLTLAIMAALLVEAGGLPFAIPLDRVERTLRLSDHAVRSVAGQKMLMLRDGALPLHDASQVLNGGHAGDAEHAVIVRGNDRRLALAVSRLVGQRELVTRPLPPDVSERAAVTGGAVLSNGQIALIVDCDALTTGENVQRAPLAQVA